MKKKITRNDENTNKNQTTSKRPTIVRLDPVLKKKLKHIGIEQDKSLNTIIEEALVDFLKKYE